MRMTLPAIALLAGFIAIPVTPAMADVDLRDAVHDKRTNVVSDKRGNCVRTRWVGGADECGAKVVAVVERQRRVLNQEERTVYFEFDKAGLTADSSAKLDALANTIKDDKSVREARIVGFADRMGSQSYNERLSQRRAAAVQDYLTKRGVINSRVTETRWLGESVPVTNCAEDLARAEKIACLQRDRRVEIEIDYVATPAQ